MSTVNIRNSDPSITLDAGQDLAELTPWHIDSSASRVEFAIRKRLFFVRKLTVRGRFADIRGTIRLDEQEPANSRADVAIGAASIDTQNPRRDKHLRTADFFDVEHYPSLTFRSHHIEPIDRAAGRYRVMGNLTVRDVTREVSLETQYTPAQLGVREPLISLTLTTSLNRRDFGMVWNSPVINVANELTVTLAIEATHA